MVDRLKRMPILDKWTKEDLMSNIIVLETNAEESNKILAQCTKSLKKVQDHKDRLVTENKRLQERSSDLSAANYQVRCLREEVALRDEMIRKIKVAAFDLQYELRERYRVEK